uniref:Uncharacterized protein n=1 Tax=Physcomitrium patens TaxID=3218 RepID=A0A2K1KEK0_PHYPA|nr:hypothetical protein PHYPA_008578 [Physcomitrium patens]
MLSRIFLGSHNSGLDLYLDKNPHQVLSGFNLNPILDFSGLILSVSGFEVTFLANHHPLTASLPMVVQRDFYSLFVLRSYVLLQKWIVFITGF